MEVRAEKLERKSATDGTTTGDWLIFAGALLVATGKILNTS